MTLVGVPLGQPLPEGGLPDDSDQRRVDLGADDYAEERCLEVVDRAAVFLRRVADLPTRASPHLPAVQAAALLLRLCGCGKVTHLLRSNPPARTAAAARRFDEALLKAYEDLASLDPLTPEEQAQVRLPLRLGGRGLRGQEQLAPAAWVASWAQCLPEVLARTGLDELEDLETCDLPLAQSLRSALAQLPERQANEEELPSWRELALEPRKKLQRDLSKRLDNSNQTALLASLDAEDRARLNSCAGPLAAGWQLASPGQPQERLDDRDYALTARALLGQSLASDGLTCRCKLVTGDRAGEACGAAMCRRLHHAYRCAAGGGLKRRSAAVEDAWEGIYRDCGYHVDRQVAVPTWDRFRWRCPCGARGLAFDPPGPCASCGSQLAAVREEAVLDLEVRSAEVPGLFLDVTVRHPVPGDADRLARAATRAGATNREAEQDKCSRYPSGRAPWKALPLALESFGRHGPAALAQLRKLARGQAARLEEGRKAAAGALLLRWGCRLGVALHRANAANLRRALGANAGHAQLREALAAAQAR